MSCRAPSSFVCAALKVTVSGTLTDPSDSGSYTWKGSVCVCVREREKGLQPKSWYVCLSWASRSLASSAQTAADPCGDSSASGCCQVPLKTPRPCLSDWPYGRQYHLDDPCCARHVLWGTGGKHGSLSQLFHSSHLVLGSTRWCKDTDD